MVKAGLANLTPSQGGDLQVHLRQKGLSVCKDIYGSVAVHPCDLCQRLSCFLRGHAACRWERKQKCVAEVWQKYSFHRKGP